MYQLEEHKWFWLLFLILGLVIVFLWTQVWKFKTRQQFSNSTLLKRLSPDQSLFKSVLKLITLSLALTCLIIGLVNPKIGTKLETVKREGVDIVFALDVSKSMLAEDIAPNRLEKAKQLTTQIINTLISDRVGIIAYAGTAIPQLPITTDYGAAKMFLQNINTDMLSSQGTAIDEAIELSRTYYNDDEQTNRVLIILSDGEDHNNASAGVAEDAAEEGIKVFTIGVGSAKGGPIPIKRNGIVLRYKKDNSGEVVITKLNPDTLIEIAENGNGIFIDGKKTQDVVNTITGILKKMDKKEFEAKNLPNSKINFNGFWDLAYSF